MGGRNSPEEAKEAIKYEKNGKRYTAPFHVGKEINNRFAKKLLKEMGI